MGYVGKTNERTGVHSFDGGHRREVRWCIRIAQKEAHSSSLALRGRAWYVVVTEGRGSKVCEICVSY